MAYAGHVTAAGVSCQANIMATERVWPAMLEAFTAAAGSLTSRLLATLDAAEREGGDLRGRQSAAILVVAPMPSRGGPSSHYASRTTPTRSPSCGGWWRSRARTRSRGGPTS